MITLKIQITFTRNDIYSQPTGTAVDMRIVRADNFDERRGNNLITPFPNGSDKTNRNTSHNNRQSAYSNGNNTNREHNEYSNRGNQYKSAISAHHYNTTYTFNAITPSTPPITPNIPPDLRCSAFYAQYYKINNESTPYNTTTMHNRSKVTDSLMKPSYDYTRPCSAQPIKACRTPLKKKRIRKRKGLRNIITDAYSLLRQMKRLPKFCQLITNKGIHNLSVKKLTLQEEAILSLGLKFIIKPPPNSKNEILNSYNSFVRSVRLKNQFLGANASTLSGRPLLRIPNKSFVPSPAGKALENYITQVRYKLLERIQSINKEIQVKYKMPKIFTVTIKNLKKDSSILICNADKNLGICIVDREWYEKEALRQLQNVSTYMQITKMPHGDIFIARIDQILNKHKKDSPKIRDYFLQNLKNKATKESSNSISRFYLTIKIHKNPITGRPIIASIGSFTYYISKYLDSILQNVLKTLPSYLRNTDDLIVTLETELSNLPDGFILYTADIKDMYPSININDGLLLLKEALIHFNTTQNEDNKIDIDFIVDLAEFVLKNNFFIFGLNTFWLQISGTAMGTPLAVTFACIYINQLELLAIKKLKENTIEFGEICLYYKRYIDDIFAIFTSEEKALQFFTTFNELRPNRIELITTHIGTSVTFMDLDIFIKRDSNKIFTKIYQKPQNAYLYLPPSSFHQKHIFKNTITAELRRYKLKCTIDEDYCNIKNELYNRLLTRGYEKEYLDPIFLKEQEIKRNTLVFNLIHKSRTQQIRTKINTPVIFSITNTPLVSRLKISNLLQLTEELESDPIHQLIFPTYKGRNKPIVTYRRAKNMRDLLTRSAYLHPLNTWTSNT